MEQTFLAPHLYAVTRPITEIPWKAQIDFLLAEVEAAIQSGVRWIQWRDKRPLSSLKARAVAKPLLELCKSLEAELVINDRLALAQEIGTHLHVGADTANLNKIRRQLLPYHFGVSCYQSIERAVQMYEQGAGYVSFGTCFPSATKPQAQFCSFEILQKALEKLPCSVVAIGGINQRNLHALIKLGIRSVAVCEGIWSGETSEKIALPGPDIVGIKIRCEAMIAEFEAAIPAAN
ncbi:MAG: thiamine phosphate synthase [Pseudomonadota bacterium]